MPSASDTIAMVVTRGFFRIERNAYLRFMAAFQELVASPLLSKEGWMRPQENSAKRPLNGADGVVVSRLRRRATTLKAARYRACAARPSAPANEASRRFS